MVSLYKNVINLRDTLSKIQQAYSGYDPYASDLGKYWAAVIYYASLFNSTAYTNFGSLAPGQSFASSNEFYSNFATECPEKTKAYATTKGVLASNTDIDYENDYACEFALDMLRTWRKNRHEK